MAVTIAALEECLVIGRIAVGGIKLARGALAGDAVPLDVTQVRAHGRHSLGADAAQARFHHGAGRTPPAAPIAACQQPPPSGPAADPAAIQPPAPDPPFISRASCRATPAPHRTSVVRGERVAGRLYR